MSAPTYESITTASRDMYARARAVLPGGNSRTAVFSSPYPIYAASGNGSRVVDLDGTARIDFLNNSTTLVHGHAHPEIVAAIADAAARGTCFGLPTESEVLFAEALCSRNEAFEQARFTSSGTEAVMMAVQASRAHTGKAKIAKIAGAYHGAYDSVAVNNDGSNSLLSHSHTAGMPAEVIANTIVIPFNDPEGAVEVLRRHVDELACVLIDPVPWRIGLVPTSTEYLAALRAFCDETGVLLVSDEVGSFRIGYGGAMGALGAVADLTVMGKVIGGGMPIGAVAGKAEVMSVFDPSNGKPKLPHSGSYNANPVSMTAGVASLRLLTEEQMRRIGVLGEQVRDAMRKTIEANDLDWQVNGMASLFRVLTGTVPGSSATPAKLGHLLFQSLLENGILIGDSGLGCVSTPMIEADIDEFGAAFDTAVTATIDRARAEG
ncbi:aspartate aminotransferase family protein [Lentzea nigeriaca]|uniref:aspartate aminotransferase family protein n=1 Tax=Lentzea nigeriaca TaxID=1128665 RepID=UPI00195D4BB5|nr:aminotransferase class III-fold pyridoxal phosphate-dependent enzyme [Lentzea nigeriaca]MBM7856450.1 glutamate-1-semialdehyde 2,1-aminomutase [Lentzea nigeriaca]